MSLAESRLVSKSSISKNELVAREADVLLGETAYGFHLTIKHGILIPSAGIDESNSETDDYILFPEDPYRSARELGLRLRRDWGLEHLGIVVTDSHTTPLRIGVTGVSLAHWGFRAVLDRVGSRDIFGRELRVTRQNLVDGIAAASVLMMGEGDEQRPLAWVDGVHAEFTSTGSPDEIAMSPADDLYAPLFRQP